MTSEFDVHDVDLDMQMSFLKAAPCDPRILTGLLLLPGRGGGVGAVGGGRGLLKGVEPMTFQSAFPNANHYATS